MEDRARRRDLLVDEDAVFDFFDARIPDDITDVRRFDRWWRDEVGEHPHLLDLSVDDLLATDDGVDEEAFPTALAVDEGSGNRIEVPVDYAFDPGAVRDGAIFEVPVALLNRTDPEPFEWIVPGLRLELITEMIRGLPKAVRRHLVPAPERAVEAYASVDPSDGPLRVVLAKRLSHLGGVSVDPSMWDGLDLPSHLRPWFRVIGDEGAVLAEGDDLRDLERRLRAHVRSTVVDASPDLERDGLTEWSIGTLPRSVTSSVGGLDVEGYPALVDLGETVGVRVLASRSEQHALHWNGARRLLRLQLPRPARTVQKTVEASTLLGLATAPHGSLTTAVDDALDAVLDALLLDQGGPPWDEAGFSALQTTTTDRYVNDLTEVVTAMAVTVQHAGRLRDRLSRPAPVEWSAALDDITTQLAHLVFDGMAVSVGAARVLQLPRYLDAIDVRLDRLREGVRADAERMAVVHRAAAEHASLVAEHGLTATLDDVRWMIEELRVQQFAQHLGTDGPVSAQRIRRALDRVRRGTMG